MNKVVFFDFCETITDFQTADAFVDFVRERTGKRRMKIIDCFQRLLWKTRIIIYLERFIPGHSLNKRIKLFQVKGFTESELYAYSKEYYEERVRPHFIKPVIKELLSLKSQQYCVGLVSGGYGIYLKHFIDEFGLDFCISSNIDIENGICTGKLKGVDCLGSNKIKLIKEKFVHKPDFSISFSDSSSDLPLLTWTNNGIVVSKEKHQQWIEKYNLQEIIW